MIGRGRGIVITTGTGTGNGTGGEMTGETGGGTTGPAERRGEPAAGAATGSGTRLRGSGTNPQHPTSGSKVEHGFVVTPLQFTTLLLLVGTHSYFNHGREMFIHYQMNLSKANSSNWWERDAALAQRYCTLNHSFWVVASLSFIY